MLERLQEEERERVLPVVAALAARGATVSVDTMRSGVAADSVRAGASLVNDVSGGLADPGMAEVVAGTGVRFVVMHWRGHSAHMQQRAVYADVVAEVREKEKEILDGLFRVNINDGEPRSTA